MEAQDIYTSNDSYLYQDDYPWQLAGWNYVTASYDVQLYYDTTVVVHLQDSQPFHFLDTESGSTSAEVLANVDPGATYYIISELYLDVATVGTCPDGQYYDIFAFWWYGGLNYGDWYFGYMLNWPDICIPEEWFYVGNLMAPVHTPCSFPTGETSNIGEGWVDVQYINSYAEGGEYLVSLGSAFKYRGIKETGSTYDGCYFQGSEHSAITNVILGGGFLSNLGRFDDFVGVPIWYIDYYRSNYPGSDCSISADQYEYLDNCDNGATFQNTAFEYNPNYIQVFTSGDKRAMASRNGVAIDDYEHFPSDYRSRFRNR
jgi:hypothetical protein